MSRTFIAAIVSVVWVTVVDVQAQSLGDAARQEGERRQAVKSTAKVLTNKDLRSAPPPSSPPPASAPADTSAPASGAPTADAKAGDKKDEAPSVEGGVKDQKYWRGRMQQLQEQLERDRTLADALQSRINALTTDFVNRDDPAQRGVLASDRQKAIAELDRLKKSIADTTRAIPALEEEARRANVPAGWLR